MGDLQPIADALSPFVIGAGLIFTRIVMVLTMVPGFAQGTLPTRVRLIVAVLLTGILDLSLGVIAIPVPENFLLLIRMVGREMMIGAGMGLALRILLATVEAAGAVAGINMGLSLNVLIDPTSGEETMTLGSVMSLCAALMFVAMDGHHMIITALHDHLHRFNVGETGYTAPNPDIIIDVGLNLVKTAFVLASPVVVVTLLLNISLALISRVVPSVNLFGIGLGLLTFAGLLTLTFEADAVLLYVQHAMDDLPDQMTRLSGVGNVGG